METPSSTMRRVTRSQASIASQKTKKEDSVTRSALVDITNDSPIIGLAITTEKTPSSSVVKNRVRAKNTPGSGEALLRGQVKSLLQKVEEEAEFVNKVYSGERPPFRVLLGLPGPSPVQIMAPTPANTPLVLSVVEENASKNAGPIQVAEAVKPEEPAECMINRALLFDSPEKSEATMDSTVSSSLSHQYGGNRSYTEKSPEYDSSSAWSTQVNASIQGEGEEEAEDFDGEGYDDLCEGLSKMTVGEFEGRHTRFVYDSDDEIEGEEVVDEKDAKAAAAAASPSVVVLKGLPVPEGKHLWFHDEEEEEEEEDEE